MNKEFFQRNRKKLLEKIQDNSFVVLFQEDAPYKSADYKYPFVQNRNFYYITGYPRENAVYMLFKQGNNITEKLFIERQDPIMARWYGERLTVEEAQELTGMENVEYLDQFEDNFGRIISRVGAENLYLDLERQEFGIRITKTQDFASEILRRYPYLKLHHIGDEIGRLRAVKSEEEIAITKRAIEITKEGIYNMWAHAKPGMMEYEIEAYFEYSLVKNGSKFRAFNNIVAAGHNSTVLHYDANTCRANDGDVVLLDLGAQYQLYNGDLSRTFPVNGKFTSRQKEVYDGVLAAQKAVEAAVKPGATWNDIENVARKELANACKGLGIIKEDSELSKYYFHSIGHYLGLDTHDIGDYNAKLEPGMIITNEPGLYIPEENIGVRIEDDLLVTEDGCINLAKDVIKEADDVEHFMAEQKKCH